MAQVIQRVNQWHSLQDQILFVFPTPLSIDYFQQLLNKEKSSTQYSCCTLHDIMVTDAKMVESSKLVLLKELHAISNLILNKAIPFDQFYSWGITLLQDFNLLDTYLLNSSNLFLSLVRQKQLATSVPINNFIFNDAPEIVNKSATDHCFSQKEPSCLEEKLSLIYEAFTKKMVAQGRGHAGLIYRKAANSKLSEKFMVYHRIVFAGFNLLTPAEEKFLMKLKSVTPVEFFWDTDTYYLDHEMNVAGSYLRRYREKKNFEQSFGVHQHTYFNDPNKNIVITEVSDTIVQIQLVIDILKEKTDQGTCKYLPNKTGIVVSGTDLLMPLLHKLAALSIPLHFKLNYPLSATVIYTLVKKLVTIWEKTNVIQETNHQDIYSDFMDSLALLRPFVHMEMQEQISSILAWGSTYLYDQEVLKNKLGKFSVWFNGGNKELSLFLQEILTFVDNHFTAPNTFFLQLNKAALHHIIAWITSLGIVTYEDGGSVLFLLNYLKKSTIPFDQTNPEIGLYIVEITEAHNLDFENLFFLNMSEGYFPKTSHNDSFISYNLRNNFGLPLEDKKLESITAYGFYRLLQRAQNVYCSFAKQNESNTSNEMNRLLLQLSYDSKLKITSHKISLHFSELPRPVIAVQKNDKVMQLLERFLVKGVSSSLTPSALISYLSCPLQFYFSYLLQIRQNTAAKDQDVSLHLGLLLHGIMERLYKPFIGIMIDTNIITKLKSKVKTEAQAAVSTLLTKLGSTMHKSMLLSSILEKLVERILELDDIYAPFKLLGVEVGREQPMAVSLSLDKEKRVRLTGIIDRIDIKESSIRIIDYKTGVSNRKISNISSLFDSVQIKKNKAVFQIVFYAWLFSTIRTTDKQKSIAPYLISVRELFVDLSAAGIYIQQPGDPKKYTQVKDIMDHVKGFEEGLVKLLSEIFNPSIAFNQTGDREICAYCPYVGICQRE
ncbi:PD-(D/E)XK nuclease family protein [Cardinium endosymbiont of Tipula unca]|uniref:PD-(D/E)XK nuclease family protein n=1 Tax=Cardinium endosymbiont of Tipula unca TaxID=3066216 RepID=UPI0030D48027